MTPQPLSDAELERMHQILERFGDKRAMNLEQLDGFLAALLCGPDEVPQSENAIRTPLQLSPYYRTLPI